MLEEILKSINSNLERIANTLDGSNKFSKELVRVNTSDVKDVVKVMENTISVSQPQIQSKTESISKQQMGVTQAIPTVPIQESFTQEQLAVAMSNAVSGGKMNIIQGILQQLGVQALTQVNPADYNKVAVMLKEAGVKV